jgi:hypothetical protein
MRYIRAFTYFSSLDQLYLMTGPVAMYWSSDLNFTPILGLIDTYISFFHRLVMFIVSYAVFFVFQKVTSDFVN